ncbi:uncharacterized protein N7469_005010 [Penicillium citrinum]|uniref:Uncharacterized protein n=1 Tax=Penicillium citrinum TaxID=5077 RepID=A0A9W9TQE9_PENCI|nr:uncharacterized protein N7469_005010 [Penicillium citrinum]KAJ5233244.1 hypothetical protein N7469_005010 [Penicillium citrinum]
MARPDDFRTQENQIFTTSSACEALEWVEKMQIDVVSMSSSFELKLERPEHERFKTIVQRIVSAGKPIIFASLPDMSSATKTSTYAPVDIQE